MALSDEVQLRYDAQILKELTNPRDPTATTVNATKLTQACNSVLAWFKVFVQAEYDSTDTSHVEVACQGVISLLQRWGGSTGGTARVKWDDWKEQCNALARVGPRGHQAPVSGSVLTPSTPSTTDGVPVRPEFDSDMFRRQIPSRNREGNTGRAT